MLHLGFTIPWLDGSNADTRSIILDGISTLHVANKDIQLAITKESCETRGKSAEQFAALQLQACRNTDELKVEMLKGFHTTQLEALKNKCDLEAKIAACCCKLEGEHSATRALVLSEGTKRVESENANLRMELLLKNHAPGNSGK